MEYDFGGYATKNDLRCSDGKTIRSNAFKECDGTTVPLVWMHQHDEIDQVLGHATLENRSDGVYAYCKFNDTENGKNAKALVQSGDVDSLSIWANNLTRKGGDILHGTIREVSLVLSGANPGAHIDSLYLAHSGEENDTEAIIYSPFDIEEYVEHSDESAQKSEKKESDIEEQEAKENNEEKNMENNKENNKEKTVGDIFDEFTEEQKNVVYYMIGQALENAGVDIEEGENEEMKHNAFEGSNEEVLQQDAFNGLVEESIKDAKKYGSMKESFLAHADSYGITNIDYLFPDARATKDIPDFIERDQEWVANVMSGTHHTPFSRIKSVFANITEDEARAKGYLKGKKKKEEVFSLLKRTTTPQTIYKKQKLDRDDVIDITDFDVVAWLKQEMRKMLDEEIARAILVGDGRLSSDEDKILETNIRPIATDNELYSIKVGVANGSTAEETAKNYIKAAVRARKDYKGSGTPTAYMTEDLLADMLLIEDGIGHPMYKSETELATAMRVNKIVTVPVMTSAVPMIIVNLSDYTVGADKGGAVSMFDDFDIDYNQQKYLIETRCSGALTKPYSAIVLSPSKGDDSEVGA